MKFTAPVFILKQHAKALSRKEKIPLHQALDRIASREGFSTWSLLAAKTASDRPSERFLEQLRSGDIALIAARPGQGKTLFSLELAIKTMRQGNRAAFFTLEFTQADVAACFEMLDEKLSNFTDRLLIDDSDQICADYIAARLASAPAKMLVIIDYLQLLDQKRLNAKIADQVLRLKALARERQLIIVCLSQIDRRYDDSKQAFPGFGDVRLPNPLDISLFNHACFLNRGSFAIGSAGIERDVIMGGLMHQAGEEKTQRSVLGLWGVRYQVQDVSRSIAFYTEQLGFKLDQKYLPAFAQVSIGDFKLILSGPGASGSRLMPDGRKQEPGGWNRVILHVDDLPARIEALKNGGLHFRNQMEVGPGGKQIQLEDPDGNPIELFEPAR